MDNGCSVVTLVPTIMMEATNVVKDHGGGEVIGDDMRKEKPLGLLILGCVLP